MVDRADLDKVSALWDEARTLKQATEFFDQGALIVAMMLEGPLPAGAMITLPTRGWTYPPQMVTSIRQLIEDRLRAIDAELSKYGVAS